MNPKTTPDNPDMVALTKKKNIAAPAAACAVIAAAVLAFTVGRSTAPNPSAPVGGTPAETGHAEEEHEEAGGHEEGHEEHGEGEGHGDEHGHDEAIVFDEKSARTAGITVAPVTAISASGGVTFNGQIEASPLHVVRISSVVPGRVTRLFVAVGDKVQKGQTLAVIESRSVGEAQSAYQQAQSRYGNANSNLRVVLQQAQAGVFSKAPLEAARRAQSEAAAEVRSGETALRQARAAYDNTQRLARVGSFASPALETARAGLSAATESLQTAQATLANATASVGSAEAELRRRKQLASSGSYAARPAEEARRALVAAQSSRTAAQSEVVTTRANLNRAKSLLAEGLISQRDLEAAQGAFDSATSRLDSSQSDAEAANRELERQQQLASSNVVGNAEVQQAQSVLAGAQADVRTRRAEVQHAEESVKLAKLALSRERAVFSQGIADRREVGTARANFENAANALAKARQTLTVTSSALQREERIFKGDLNNIAQVQAARSQAVQAAADLRAARSALALMKSSPNGSAIVPIRAPISGTVQEPDIAQGEVITAEKQLMTIADLSIVHIDAYLPEADASRVAVGSPFRATIDALPGRVFTGRLELVHNEVDPKTRMVEAHAEIVNKGELRPGMFARGRIETAGSSGSVLSVPADAVQSAEGKSVVYVENGKPNSFVAREVVTGATETGRTVIKAGLKSGERIVVKGAFMVKAQAMKAELGHEH